MTAAQRDSIKNRLETVIALSRLLERVESAGGTGGTGVGADQYRALVLQLQVALAQEMPDDALQAVLGAYPSAAEVYENLHYARSGLSRSSLERSIGSEMLASEALARAARR